MWFGPKPAEASWIWELRFALFYQTVNVIGLITGCYATIQLTLHKDFVGSGWSLLVISLDDFAALGVMKVDDCQIAMSSLLYKESVIVFIVAPQNTNPTE